MPDWARDDRLPSAAQLRHCSRPLLSISAPTFPGSFTFLSGWDRQNGGLTTARPTADAIVAADVLDKYTTLLPHFHLVLGQTAAGTQQQGISTSSFTQHEDRMVLAARDGGDRLCRRSAILPHVLDGAGEEGRGGGGEYIQR